MGDEGLRLDSMARMAETLRWSVGLTVKHGCSSFFTCHCTNHAMAVYIHVTFIITRYLLLSTYQMMFTIHQLMRNNIC